MAPVGGGVEGNAEFDSSADGDQVSVGGGGQDAQAGRRGPLASPLLRGGALAVAALGVGLLAGALAFGSGEDQQTTAAPPSPGPTVTVTESSEPVAPAEIAPAEAVANPARLVIPSLEIDDDLIELFVDESGTMGVPETATEIGWWEDGPAPGEPGGSLIAAHVNLDGSDGAFANLDDMEIGETIVVDREDGTTATYQVASVEQFAKDDFPDERVYTYEGPTRLHLVTCGGAFDRNSGSYDDNIVVFADLVSDTRAPAGA